MMDLFNNPYASLLPEDQRRQAQSFALMQMALPLLESGRGGANQQGTGAAAVKGLLSALGGYNESILSGLKTQKTVREIQAAQREQAARDLAANMLSPNETLNASDALSADMGRAGPTPERAAMIGQPNPAAAVPMDQRFRNVAMDPRIATAVPDFAKTLAGIANEAGPKYEFVNGVRQNMRSPSQNFIPKMAEGEEPVFDARGQIIGIRNMQGSISALAQRQDVQRGAEARYQFEQIFNPQTGQREFVSREQMARGGAPGGRGAAGAGAGGMISDPGPLEADLAKQVATTINEGRTKAEAARSSLRLNSIVEPLLANTITGPLANQQLSIARVLAQAGIGQGTVADTETFALTKARGVLDLVKNLGAGVSISNADLRFAEQIAGKEISLNAETLKRLIQIENKLAEQAISGHNTRVDQVFRDRPVLGGVGKDYFRVEPFTKSEKPAAPGAPAAGGGWSIRPITK